MKLFRTLLRLTFLFVLLAFFSHSALAADSDEEFYSVRQTITEGSPWRQHISELPVDEVEVALFRESGGNQVFVNLRFFGGDAFENLKKEYFKTDLPQKIIWHVNGEVANGRDLTLNVYDGKVNVESVTVRYRKSTLPVPIVNSPTTIRTVKKADANQQASIKCPHMTARRPKVQVSSQRPTEGIFSGKYIMHGTIEGNCIKEAGYYEYGRIVRRLDIPLSDKPVPFEFELQVKSGASGDIRAITFDGQTETAVVDELIKLDSNP